MQIFLINDEDMEDGDSIHMLLPKGAESIQLTCPDGAPLITVNALGWAEIDRHEGEWLLTKWGGDTTFGAPVTAAAVP